MVKGRGLENCRAAAAKRLRCLGCTKLHFKLVYGSAAEVGEESRCFLAKDLGVYSRLHTQLRSTTMYATILIALPCPLLFNVLFISGSGAAADVTCSITSLKATLFQHFQRLVYDHPAAAERNPSSGS